MRVLMCTCFSTRVCVHSEKPRLGNHNRFRLDKKCWKYQDLVAALLENIQVANAPQAIPLWPTLVNRAFQFITHTHAFIAL